MLAKRCNSVYIVGFRLSIGDWYLTDGERDKGEARKAVALRNDLPEAPIVGQRHGVGVAGPG